MPMIPFRKMNGLGNDFLVVDARAALVRPPPEVIRKLADRRSGVGFDQFITIERGRAPADVFMRIDNADGGEVEACGNATRCVGRAAKLANTVRAGLQEVGYAHNDLLTRGIARVIMGVSHPLPPLGELRAGRSNCGAITPRRARLPGGR